MNLSEILGISFLCTKHTFGYKIGNSDSRDKRVKQIENKQFGNINNILT